LYPFCGFGQQRLFRVNNLNLPCFGYALPQPLNRIVIKSSIRTDDTHLLDNGLRDDESINRIAVEV